MDETKTTDTKTDLGIKDIPRKLKDEIDAMIPNGQRNAFYIESIRYALGHLKSGRLHFVPSGVFVELQRQTKKREVSRSKK